MNLIPWPLAALVNRCIVLENLQFCHGPLTCGLYAEGSVSAASFLERMKCDVDMYHQLNLQSGLFDTNKTCNSHVVLHMWKLTGISQCNQERTLHLLKFSSLLLEPCLLNGKLGLGAGGSQNLHSHWKCAAYTGRLEAGCPEGSRRMFFGASGSCCGIAAEMDELRRGIALWNSGGCQALYLPENVPEDVQNAPQAEAAMPRVICADIQLTFNADFLAGQSAPWHIIRFDKLVFVHNDMKETAAVGLT